MRKLFAYVRLKYSFAANGRHVRHCSNEEACSQSMGSPDSMCCREIMTQLLPHLVQDTGKTQILPFYSFAAVQRDPPNQHAVQSAKVAGRASHTGMDGR